MTPATILTIWVEPNWPSMVALSTQAASAYAALGADARTRMHRALIAARKARDDPA